MIYDHKALIKAAKDHELESLVDQFQRFRSECVVNLTHMIISDLQRHAREELAERSRLKSSEMIVYSTYHNEQGVCLKEDWDDAKSGKSPSGMVRVVFQEFRQAVPIVYLKPMTSAEHEAEMKTVRLKMNPKPKKDQ